MAARAVAQMTAAMECAKINDSCTTAAAPSIVRTMRRGENRLSANALENDPKNNPPEAVEATMPSCALLRLAA